MIMSYQDEMRLRKRKSQPMKMGIIAGVYSDGVTLLLDGKESMKKYKFNGGFNYNVGDRVKLNKISGVYVVEYKI